jgi:hypothetical protein
MALGTMIDKSGSRMRLTQLKAGLNKWRIAFLVFALFYAVLLVLNLSNVPMQWDEVVLYVNNADHAKNLMIKIAFF